LDLFPSWRSIKCARGKALQRTQEDIQYERLSWGFIGLAFGSIAAYIAIMGSPIPLSIEIVEEEEEEEEDEEDEEDGGEFEEAEDGDHE
jgi:sorting and assembly machinery component 37